MKHVQFIGMAVSAAALFALTACSPSTSTAEKAPSTPTKAGEVKPVTGKLEVVAFKGGYGIDFYEAAAKEFAAKNPGVTADVSGDPRVWEKLRPRFISNDVPDLVFPGWGMDQWALAEEGQLQDLTAALKEPAFDGKGTWGETFDPNLLKLGQSDGKQYMLPYYLMLYGWWYDPDVFKKNGWTPPKSYAELLTLCEKIKAKGIAPLTYQGKYPYYMIEGILMPWVYSIGGAEAVKSCQNMEPGAWKSPAMLQAAKMIVELKDKGYLENGATAMTHTESQTEFLQGKAAMIPCGTWLYSEMKNVMPPAAKMEFFLPPVVDGGKGEPSALLVGIEPWMIPTKAKNPDAGIAFFKYMTSLEKAKQFVKEKGTLMSIKGSEDTELPEVLKTPAASFKGAKEVWSVQYKFWYPSFETEFENSITSMLNGQATAEQFCDRVEAAADKVRKDSAITKHKL